MRLFILFFLVTLCYPLQGATLHVLLMADTNDRKIGASVRSDLNNVSRQIDEIARFTEMSLNKSELTGNLLVTRRALGFIDQLSVAADDAIIIYYSGHGFRRQNKSTKWPFLSLEDSSLDFFHLVTAAKEKKPRLLLAISDSCNNFLNRSVGPVVSKSSRSIQAANYQKLFLQSKGSVIATASSPGEFAWGGTSGGAFTLQFLNRLDGIVRGPTQQASWKNLMQQATVATGSGQTRQKPIFEMSLVNKKKFSPGATILALTGNPEKWHPGIVRSSSSSSVKVNLFLGRNITLANHRVSSFNWMPGTFIECKIGGTFQRAQIKSVEPTNLQVSIKSGATRKAAMKDCRAPKEQVNQFISTTVETNETTINTNTTNNESDFQCNNRPARIVRKMGSKRYIVEYNNGSKAVVFRRNCTGGASDTENVTRAFSEGSKVICQGKQGKIIRTIGKKLLIDFTNGKRDILLKSKCKVR